MNIQEVYETYVKAPLLAGEEFRQCILVEQSEHPHVIRMRDLPTVKAHLHFFLLQMGRSVARAIKWKSEAIDTLFMTMQIEDHILLDVLQADLAHNLLALARMRIQVIRAGGGIDLCPAPIEELDEEKEPLKDNALFAFYTGLVSEARITDDQLVEMMKRYLNVGEA